MVEAIQETQTSVKLVISNTIVASEAGVGVVHVLPEQTLTLLKLLQPKSLSAIETQLLP